VEAKAGGQEPEMLDRLSAAFHQRAYKSSLLKDVASRFLHSQTFLAERVIVSREKWLICTPCRLDLFPALV
jgi:hypothetical protein